ncbi:4,5-DOPA-extradiol-dioxygenase [Clostridium nigeriense]|uniref:4,5-DOPA-extradiol-dioxygenase n=1 Tax=Clostridium nigeriense TaxID=1805470 RepID=UPI000836FA7A|nr:4,5-DOPA dioxygenase extradiol [Clostridium nigeriense]
MNRKMPVLFLSHGSPMNVVLDNEYTRALINLGQELEMPNAILIISAHFKTKGTYLTYSEKPKQIYDFYGFPEEIYNIKYEPNGGKEYAEKIYKEIKADGVKLTDEWGLDHAAWGVLKYLYPNANIPTMELSLNAELTEEEHYKIGKKLSKLREEGVLIIGSGNIVHNLGDASSDVYGKPYEWAEAFDNYIIDSVKEYNHNQIISYKALGDISKLAVPTDEHFLPLLYVIGAQEKDDKVEIIHRSIQNSSVSMSCIKIGE